MAAEMGTVIKWGDFNGQPGIHMLNIPLKLGQ